MTGISSKRWQPIAFFNPKHFPEDDVLVWLIDEDGNGFACVAHWDCEYDAEGHPFGKPRITGHWRRIEGLADLEPVAFAAIEGPDLEMLKQIIERVAA